MEDELIERIKMGDAATTASVRRCLKGLMEQARLFGAGSTQSTFWFNNEHDEIEDDDYVPYVAYGVKLKSEIQ